MGYELQYLQLILLTTIRNIFTPIFFSTLLFPFLATSWQEEIAKRRLVISKLSRQINGKPSKKGLYIHKGEGKTEKVII